MWDILSHSTLLFCKSSLDSMQTNTCECAVLQSNFYSTTGGRLDWALGGPQPLSWCGVEPPCWDLSEEHTLASLSRAYREPLSHVLATGSYSNLLTLLIRLDKFSQAVSGKLDLQAQFCYTSLPYLLRVYHKLFYIQDSLRVLRVTALSKHSPGG